MSVKASRRCNRLIVVFSSVNDVTAWPFWKFLQMKKVKGVTDLSILAFNSHGGSFEARIDGQEYTLRNFENVEGYRQDMLERFLHRWYDPGRSYFVYGGHGMGDYLELEKGTTCLQCHELASIFGNKKFEAIIFDACFMASLECAYQLRHNTRYIGGCEGYLWEPDTSLDHHVFNTYTASAMSRFRDPKHILLAIQRDYCSKSPLADFAVLDTTHVEALRNYVEEHVIQRVYDHATFYNLEQQQKLSSMAEEALQFTLQNTNSDIKTPSSSSSLASSSLLSTSSPLGTGLVSLTSPNNNNNNNTNNSTLQGGIDVKAQNRRLVRRLQLQQSVQFEHALYPSESGDKHILDLKSYLIDMARDEEEAALLFKSNSSSKNETNMINNNMTISTTTTTTTTTSNNNNNNNNNNSSISASSSSSSTTTTGNSTLTSPSPRTAVVEVHGSLPLEKKRQPLQFAKGSAHEGLDLFHRVVLSHTPPEDKHIYASHLGGLSIPVYEFSTMSKPLKAWGRVDKKKFTQKAKEFLKRGAVQEVQMSERRNCTSACETEKNNLTSTSTTTTTTTPLIYLPLSIHTSKSTNSFNNNNNNNNINENNKTTRSNSNSGGGGGGGGSSPEMQLCKGKH